MDPVPVGINGVLNDRAVDRYTVIARYEQDTIPGCTLHFNKVDIARVGSMLKQRVTKLVQ